ncbi:pilus assembly protein [Defluviimonas aestuarii]|uniref:TadE/TadG family type IV pilus assembly protein n=1 Tax=Albidovulum aestuarii TaxID=1130726 RepID=UPI00249C6601|nr:pilus assembly protein [Defluviimonas aestuarii]MDI3335524.1 pilus assembly protein [Defluviimonas aestuarii]
MTIRITASVRDWLARKARDEEGSSTIPFIMFLPFFMMLILSSLEMGVLMMRHVMLERALDLSVRDLRLGNWSNPTHDSFKKVVCNRAGVIPDCMNAILVELRPVSTVTWQPLSSGPTCVDRAAPMLPEDMPEFDPGEGDEMMLIRACIKVDPVFPTTGLGMHLPKDNTGAYALVSATAFVNEPDRGT